MSKRLQVILDDEEMRAIQAIAKRHRTTVAEWVRRILRAARREEPQVEAGRKLEVVRTAARHEFPSGDIEQILAEIERGYLTGGAR
ncbi:MAG: antitoxin [Proteobacteria bacterium]|nr:antitoxin [Pseudomonadota bacterium]NIT01549.1 antitoxin [Candidatus Latescibacterota bacterium]